MTSVVIAPRRESPTTDTEVVVTGGWFQIRPSKAYVAGGQWVQPVWSDPVQLTGSAVTVLLDPLPDVPYELYMELPNGRVGPKLKINEFRIVVGAGPVGWETLVQVDGPGGGSVITDVVDARLDALESAVGGVSGGASTLAAITNMSPLARLLNTDTTQAAMQSRIGVQPSASPVFTAALTAANPTFTGALAAANPTFTGTVVIPDNALAIADTNGLQTALDAKAPLASPALTGTPVAPTAANGTNTTQVATTAFVLANAGSGAGAPLASPAFTGTPTAPTATAGTNTTQLATTAFVTAAANASGNNVVIPNATLSTARNHPVTGAVLPAAPACCVTWTTVLLATAPTAFDTNGDIWFNKES